MAQDYCTPRDVYNNGLPRGAAVEPPRIVPEGGISAATDTISLNDHGFSLNDEVQFRADSTEGAALPAPLLPAVTYYAIPVDNWGFRVAVAAGGPAIDLTSAGSRVLVYTEPPLAENISKASRYVDGQLPAHVVPLEPPFAPEVVNVTAEIAAWLTANGTGFSSPTLSALLVETRKRLEQWGRGVPIRGENASPRAGLSAAAASLNRRTGWRRFGGI